MFKEQPAGDASLEHRLADTQQAAFAQIPIIILTGSQHYRHILHSYSLWLSDYVNKPCSPDKLLEAFGKLHSPKRVA